MYSLPSCPAYYDTKPISHYLSEENKQTLYFLQNTAYINELILNFENLFENKDFKGFQLGIIPLEDNRNSIACRAFYHSKIQDKSVEKKIADMLNNLDIYEVAFSLFDMDEIEAEEVCEVLRNNGLSKIRKPEDRFDVYRKFVYSLKLFHSVTEDYNYFIEALSHGASQFKNNYFTINGVEQKKIAFSLSELKKISDSVYFAQKWNEKYKAQLLLLQIIKDFDEKNCEKLLIDSFSGRPSFYEKDNHIFKFKTNEPVDLPEYKMSAFITAAFITVNRTLDYDDFKGIHHISNYLSIEEFYETTTFIVSEKEKVALLNIFETQPDTVTSLCVNQRI